MKLKKLIKNTAIGAYVKVYTGSNDLVVECYSDALHNMLKHEEVQNMRVISFRPYCDSMTEFGLRVICK